MWPGATVFECTFTTTTPTPSPESSPTAVGVTIPDTFGKINVLEGHGSVLVVTVPFAVIEEVDSWWHGCAQGDSPLGTNPMPGYSCPSSVVRSPAYTGAARPINESFIGPFGVAM